MTDEKQRLERKVARLARAVEYEEMSPSEKQAASLGIRPPEPDGDSSKLAADRPLGR